jgi:putative transposase
MAAWPDPGDLRRRLHRAGVYIHQGPQRHGLTDDWRTWPFSSYGALVSGQPTRLTREQVLAWFDGAGTLAHADGTQADESRIGPLIAADYDQHQI